MRQFKILLLMLAFMLTATTISMGETIYEDAEDGNTSRWSIFDNTPAGALITNENDVNTSSRVIRFTGDTERNGYIIGALENTPNAWNNTQEKIISWDMNFTESFQIYVRVMTSNGFRYMSYRSDNNAIGITGNTIGFNVGASANNGTWQTIVRDLEADLKLFEPDNNLTAVNAFIIRGSGLVDNIKLDSHGTVYEDSEDLDTSRWAIYDNDPVGATVTIETDAVKASNVIRLTGTGTKNGYMLGNLEGRAGAWDNTLGKILSWDMNFNENFNIYIRVMTPLGFRYMVYTAKDTDSGLSGNYITIGLGSNTINGTWQTISRDIEADLKQYEPDNNLTSVNAFLIRGPGLLDNIKLAAPGETGIAPLFITLNGDNPMYVDVNTPFIDPGATATSILDPVVSVIATGLVDETTIGTYTLTYTATDSNATVVKTRTVHVVAGRTVYEDAEDLNPSRWNIFDSTPAGAAVTTELDAAKGSNVVRLSGSATLNGYMLGNLEGRTGAWNDTFGKTLNWDMNFNEKFNIYIRIMTPLGFRYIVYTDKDTDGGLSGNYVTIGLGSTVPDGTWKTISRDLEADLQMYEAGNTIDAVNAFLVRGSGLLDNVQVIDLTLPLL